MKKTALVLAALAASYCIVVSANPTPVVPDKAITLFNGSNLDGWKFVTKEANPDTAKTWSVSDGILRCTGTPVGYLRTQTAYSDYKLTLQWRWDPTFTPQPAPNGNPRARNNGVLVHMQGEDMVWPSSLEAQLMENYAGDFFIIGNVTTSELLTQRGRDIAIAEANNDDAAVKRAQRSRRLIRRVESSENPVGEWNTYEIVCKGGTVTVFVNGVEQNRATLVNQTSGYIALQSEGSPIEFRNIQLEPLACSVKADSKKN